MILRRITPEDTENDYVRYPDEDHKISLPQLNEKISLPDLNKNPYLLDCFYNHCGSK